MPRQPTNKSPEDKAIDKTAQDALAQDEAAVQAKADEAEEVIPVVGDEPPVPVPTGVEAVTFAEPYDMPEPKEYRKTAPVLAVKVEVPFSVETMEGTMKAKAGDYLCGPGVSGEFWPVDQKTFESSYVEVVDEDPYDGADTTDEPLMDELDRKLASGEKGTVWTS